MNVALLETAIRERLDADTGAGGFNNATNPLVNWYGEGFPPSGQREPLLIYTFPPADEDDTFQNDAVVFQVEFTIVTRRERNRLAEESAILSRLKGDGMSQSNRQPTYGFHRWLPTISGYGPTHMGRVTGFTEHTKTHRRFVEVYQIRVQEDFTG